MDIKIGKTYENNTLKYLLPCMQAHGPAFMNRLKSVYRLAVGISDSLLDNEKLTKNKNLMFILLDKKVNTRYYLSFMDWIIYQEYYITDYAFDNVLTGRQHMIVLEIPSCFNEAYDSFLKGDYSKMYSKETCNTLYLPFKNPCHLFAKKVINKDPSLIEPFMERVRKSFGEDLDINKEDFKDAELDFPIEKELEIFNYISECQNKEIDLMKVN